MEVLEHQDTRWEPVLEGIRATADPVGEGTNGRAYIR